MTFAAPLFLIALLAGLIPVLLHMINRQKAKEVPFSTLRFLRLSVQRTRRRKHIHDVLLLLLRMAALVLIAIGLAKSTISHLQNLLGRNADSAVVVILDNSASMGTIDRDASRWQRAITVVEGVLDRLNDNDSVALLVTCGRPRPEADRLFENHENLRQALSALQLSYEQADLAARLKLARELLAKSKAPNKEIYVVSDMQEVSWSGLADSSNDSTARTTRGTRSTEVPVFVIDLQGTPRPNVALRRVELHAAAPVAGVPMQATVELVGDVKIAQQKHVELYLDGQKQQISPTIAMKPGEQAKHTFQFTLDRPGLHRGEVRLAGDDACPLDNRLYFAVNLDDRIPVAIVKSQDHPIKYLEDTYYLERALTPARAGGWAIRVTPLNAGALATEPLSNYAVIYCVNLPALDPATARRLRDWVSAGGHLVWICGENVNAGEYAVMNDAADGQLVPARMVAVREPPPERPDGWHIGLIDDTHPALAPLIEPASLYQSVLVYRHMQLSDSSGGGVRVLAKLDDGSPLMVERTVGEGSVCLLGTTVHVDWTNLPLRPIFMPLMSRLTFHWAGARSAQKDFVAGMPLTIPLAGENANVQVEVKQPTGNVERLDKGDASSVLYANTHDVGIYQVRLLNSLRPRDSAYASNIDPAESNAKTLSHDELQQRFADQMLVFCDDPNDLAATVSRLREGQSVWELFLIGVLIALVAETFVANRRVSKDDELKRQPVRHATRSRTLRYADRISVPAN